MASVGQIDANRSNAQKSTGPRTPEGKEKASQNALKHGLFAQEGVIRGEDGEEFEMHREMLLEQLNPAGALEEILAARIVDLSWRLKRAVQDQSEAFAALYDRQTAGAEEPPEPAERAGMIGRMILEDFSQDAVLERLLRYERRIESSLYRTLNELRRVHDQVQKAAREDVSTLERWREEDWNARKARAFAFSPPLDVSPGPAGGTTNTPTAEVPHPCAIPSLPYASPVPDGPPGDETCKTNPIPGGIGWDGAGGASDEDETCKTNPISEEVSCEDKSFKCEVSGLKLEEPASRPRSLPTSNFTLQTSGGTPAAQSQSCKTNPNSAGVRQSSIPCGIGGRNDSPQEESRETNPMCPAEQAWGSVVPAAAATMLAVGGAGAV
jgi:hypothetical protein